MIQENSMTVPGRPTWQQTMLRIADPVKSLTFYQDLMGMTLIDTLDFPQYNFKLYFLTTLHEDETYDLAPGTQEAHVSDRCYLRLCHPLCHIFLHYNWCYPW